MQPAYAAWMDEEVGARLSQRKMRRAARLRALVQAEETRNGKGAQGRIAAEAGIPKSHMSHLMSGVKGIGDVIADRLEEMYGYPNGWMDWPEAPQGASVLAFEHRSVSLADAIGKIAEHIGALDADEREIAAMHLRAIARDPENASKRVAAVDFLTRGLQGSQGRSASGGG